MKNGKCRMHGGKSSGPTGPANGAWRGGKYSQAAREARAAVRELVRDVEALVAVTRKRAGLKVPRLYRRRRHVREALKARAAAKAAAKAKAKGPQE